MAFGDWLNSGGLFGGFSGYEGLSDEARRRANARGMFTAGASILGNSVGPLNQGFMRNISSALLAGRDDFNSMLDREAALEAQRRKEQKLLALEEEELRMKAEEEERRFNEWQTKEGQRTQMVNSLLEKTGKSFEEINALPDSDISDLYTKALFPKPEKGPIEKLDGRRRILESPDGSERFLGYLPAEPKEPPSPEERAAKADRAKESWIQQYARALAGDVTIEDVVSPDGGVKQVRTPRIATHEERLAAAEEAWVKKNVPKEIREEIDKMVSLLPKEQQAEARAEAYADVFTRLFDSR